MPIYSESEATTIPVPTMAYKVFSFQTIFDGTNIVMSELCENTFSDLGLTYTFTSQAVYQRFILQFSQALTDFSNKILVFSNSGNNTFDNSYQVKANYSYEETQLLYGYGFHNNVGSNDAFSDPDYFFRASFEIRIYI